MFRLSKELRPDEKVVWRGRPQILRSCLHACWFPAAAFTGSTVFILFFSHSVSVWLGFLPFILFQVTAVGSFFVITSLFMRPEYVITDKRILARERSYVGFIDFASVIELQVKTNLLDRICKTGSVIILAGDFELVLKWVSNSTALSKLIQDAVEKTTTYCKTCGGVLPPEAQVCPHCGTQR